MQFYEKELLFTKPDEFKRNLEFIYDGFPNSFIIVKYFLKHIGLFLNDIPSESFSKLVADSLLCLFSTETFSISQENEKNYKDLKTKNLVLLQEIYFLAGNFLTFCKLFLAKYMKFDSEKTKELFSFFESKQIQQILDQISVFDDSYIISISLKVLERKKINEKKLL